MELSKREHKENQNQKQQQVFLDAGSIFHMDSTPEEGRKIYNLKLPNKVSKLMPVSTLAIRDLSAIVKQVMVWQTHH